MTAILSLLPVKTRLRSSEVSRAWRALLADTVFWECIDFTVYDGHFSEALFVAAVAKAGGQLRQLDVSAGYIRLTFEALLNAVNTNSQTLQRLRLHEGVDDLSFELVAQLCEAAPGVRELCADVSCCAHEAHALLRREPPFGALNIHTFTLQFTRGEDEDLFLACAADLTFHGACLDKLSLYTAPLPSRVAWDALSDAAISVRLTKLSVSNTLLHPWCVPGLARLLREGSILSLRLGGSYQNGPFIDAEAEPVLSASLRANTTLTDLNLSRVDMWNAPGINIVDALVGHSTLENITLRHEVGNDAQLRLLASASLGRLVAANPTALNHLDVAYCALGDDGLRLLFAALPSNTHLFSLSAARNGIGAALAPVVLASVKANQSLHLLFIDGHESEPGRGEVSIAELREAEAVVRATRQGKKFPVGAAAQ